MIKKYILIFSGFAALALGTAGIVLPGLPTTPFVLLAAFCFSSSSPRFDAWLRRNRLFGPYIENYRTKQGISKKRKVITIAYMWAGMIVSMVMIGTPWVVPVLGFIGIGVTVHIMLLKTKAG
jgi:uncharacterized membrane protein YbaN (DUF454 family)